MNTFTATYSPDDNKLRLYAGGRLSPELYARVKGAGFSWAPKQELFVAPMWTPDREDLLLELCGEIGDEDTSLAERAEERAERFEEYGENRKADAESAHAAVAAIADNIPLGQPILIGHHSERHARKDAERIENGMRRAVKMWETSKYWEQRAAGAVRHAKYKERPDVRARRIKTIEAAFRKIDRQRLDAERDLRIWDALPDDHGAHGIKRKDGLLSTFYQRALFVANHMDHYREYPAARFPRTRPEQSTYEGSMSLWSALGGEKGEIGGLITPEQAREWVMAVSKRRIEWAGRWITHYTNRLAYERAMLADAGGLETDANKPMKGGAIKCIWAPRGGWAYIEKVNKVTVSVPFTYNPGGRVFMQKIPFDKIAAIMSPLEVENARKDGRLQEAAQGVGFYLAELPPPQPKEDTVCPDGPSCPDPVCTTERAARAAAPTAQTFEAMKETLRAGVKVVTAPQLFPTPGHLAARMVELAGIEPGHAVLEPSAGTGALLEHIPAGARVAAVELNLALADALASKFKGTPVYPGDFLNRTGWELGAPFDRVVMNPPFKDGDDIKHIRHALTMLKPGGRLVAICAGGPRQVAKLQPFADHWEELPPDTFTGTSVRAVLAVFNETAGQ